MQAVVIEGPGDISVGELPDPTPGPGEIVVAVRACGICGTDIHIADGDLASAKYPLVPGHEFAGEVVAVGDDPPVVRGLAPEREVERFRPGDLVAVDPTLFCGRCRPCRLGHENLCERWGAIGVTVGGGCAELVAVPSWNAHRLPTGFDMSLGALIEPLSCAVHGYDLIKTKLADRFIIYGAGTMGLMLLLLAERVGAASVTVVEPNEARRKKAAELGATEALASAEQLDAGRRFDIVMDATGVIAAIEDGLQRVRPGGTFLQFGVASNSATAKVSPFKIYNEEITVIGSMAVLKSYDRACDLTTEVDLNLRALVSGQYPLIDYPEVLKRARHGDGYKLQVVPS
ncbi:MAG TPA: zinc-dependent alcohol dehydrogenase family protein [Acidimicrobiales bacterium]|nr:zinc-dependent alcohol dehydrogenase family protein [Acidimicrobiales bacterium]